MAYKASVVNNLANLTDNAIVRGDGGTTGVQTSTAIISDAGNMTNTSQPAFSAYLASTVTNKTGNGASYQLGADALTEVYDQGSNFNTNGTFTAPVTGTYLLSSKFYCTSVTLAALMTMTITTSNRTSTTVYSRKAGVDESITLSILVDMDTSDTATTTIVVTGMAGNTVDFFGNGNLYSSFMGTLIC